MRDCVGSSRFAGALAFMERTGVFIFAFVVLASSAHAQTADSVIALNMVARGGLQRLRAIRSERLVGHFVMETGESAVDTVEIARPGRIRTTIHFPHDLLVQASSGRTAWMVSTLAWRGDSSAHELPPEQAKNIQAAADLDGPLVDYAAKGHQVAFAGVDTADGRPAYVLRVVTADGLHDTYFIDSVTHLQTKWIGERTIGGTTVTLETFFRDYRAMGGTMVPFRIDSDNGREATGNHFTVEAVELNVAIDSERFEVPG
ncbi:MAG TPA: hypothetical protein VFK13_05705 [Gemmatimonadaceae bacterium]|nr:hypothetical protein [Gemmatimonadaceae bacterium]